MAGNNNVQYHVLLPKDVATERTVLGTLIRRNELYGDVDDLLLPDVFSDGRNAMLFRCVRWVIRKGLIADVNSIVEAAHSHKEASKVAIDENDVFDVAQYYSEATFLQDVERLVSLYRRRKTWETLQRMCQRVCDQTEDIDDNLDVLQKQIDAIRESKNIDNSIIDARTALVNLNKVVDDNKDETKAGGIKTGFRFTDEKGGLREEALTVIAAFSGVGKTSLALNIAVNVAKAGIPVAYYSLEMSAVELWARIISVDSGVNANRILSFPLREEDIKAYDTSVGRYANLPLYIDESATSTFDKTMRSVRVMAKQRGVKLFVIDYLQVFAQVGKGEREESVIANMSRRCKNICKELKLHCLLLSQLRRDRDEQHPRMDMLRGSGQIEENADNVVLIDRPEARPEWGVSSYRGVNKNVKIEGTAEISVSKGRNIGTGVSIVGFKGKLAKFYELDTIPYKDGSTAKKAEKDNVEPPKPTATETQLPFSRWNNDENMPF